MSAFVLYPLLTPDKILGFKAFDGLLEPLLSAF